MQPGALRHQAERAGYLDRLEWPADTPAPVHGAEQCPVGDAGGVDPYLDVAHRIGRDWRDSADAFLIRLGSLDQHRAKSVRLNRQVGELQCHQLAAAHHRGIGQHQHRPVAEVDPPH